MKKLLRSWSELYKAFARCALLVPTADDNITCAQLCTKILSGLKDEAHLVSGGSLILVHIYFSVPFYALLTNLFYFYFRINQCWMRSLILHQS